MKLRCGNLEDWNKFWIEEVRRSCRFCGKGRDNLDHYMENCDLTKGWFRGLGNSSREIWDRLWSEDLDEEKGEVLVKIWKTKKKIGRRNLTGEVEVT